LEWVLPKPAVTTANNTDGLLPHDHAAIHPYPPADSPHYLIADAGAHHRLPTCIGQSC